MAASLDETILGLRARYRSDEDPAGRSFVPLAEALVRAGRLDEAAQVVDEGTSLLPDFATGHLVAAWVARDRGDAPTAEERFLRVLALDPLNVRALRDLGRLLSASGDTGGAEALFLRAAAVDGGAPGDEPGDVPGTATSAADPGDGAIPPQTAAVDVAPPAAKELPAADPGWFADSWEEEGIAEEPPFPPDGVQTRTMAELYASQGLLNRAVEVYRDLCAADPRDGGLADRLAELEALRAGPSAAAAATSPEGEGAPGSDDDDAEPDAVAVFLTAPDSPALDSPFTWTGTDGEPDGGPDIPVSEYLQEILDWAPGGEAPADETPAESTGTAVPVAHLAPDAPLPEWVPIAALAPEGPVPRWVKVDALAPDAADTSEDGSADAADAGDPDDPDDNFQAWLEGIRL